MFWKKVKEAGKSISFANMEKVQGIHDMSSDMGADCASPIWGGVYEAARIWEAALPMNTSHGDLHWKHLPNALKDHLGVKDTWEERGPYVEAVFPNHVVYSHKGQTMKQKYSLTQGAAGSDPTIAFSGYPKKVHTAYVDNEDQATESIQTLTDLPAGYVMDKERFVSKAERDGMDAKDFAGKHQSFPINSPEDVKAALDSIGRAGADNYDSATLKTNILRIAKRKGYAIPASDSSESVVTTLADDETLVSESAEFCMAPDECVEALIAGAKEAASTGKPTTIPIKIIGPGWGSMAHYSKEAIMSSGPQVFTKGTHMYWNHPTATEESERPEGSLSDLAAVLTENAKWEDNGAKGPGLYAKAKVFSDFSTQIMEKGPHVGISINTPIKFHEGEAEGRHGRIAEKFIKSPLTSADFVTRAGAKGAPIVPVQESERRSQIEKENLTMTPEETREMEVLRESNKTLTAQVSQFIEGQNVTLAVATVGAVLKEAGIDYNEKVLRRACASPVMKEGKIDTDWAKGIINDFSDGEVGSVRGLGATRESVVTTVLTEKDVKAYESALADLGMSKEAIAASRGRD